VHENSCARRRRRYSRAHFLHIYLVDPFSSSASKFQTTLDVIQVMQYEIEVVQLKTTCYFRIETQCNRFFGTKLHSFAMCATRKWLQTLSSWRQVQLIRQGVFVFLSTLSSCALGELTHLHKKIKASRAAW
jgi:hypothetical protein